MSTEIVSNKFPQARALVAGALEDIVAKAAYDIVGHAKSVVPVDTGKLKNSIEAHRETSQRWAVQPHTDYAVYVEYGTSRMEARPYLRPAASKVARALRSIPGIKVKL